MAPQLVTFKVRSPFLSSNSIIWSFSLVDPLTNPEPAKKRTHRSAKILVIFPTQECPIKEGYYSEWCLISYRGISREHWGEWKKEIDKVNARSVCGFQLQAVALLYRPNPNRKCALCMWGFLNCYEWKT